MPAPAPPTKREQYAQEIATVLELIEPLGPQVEWKVGVLTGIEHAFGIGVYVSLCGPGTEAHPQPIAVFEKHRDSFISACRRAIARYQRRLSGEQFA